MPIVEQVQMVLNGTMAPKDLGPHLATSDTVPQPESGLGGNEHTSVWQRLSRRLKGTQA